MCIRDSQCSHSTGYGDIDRSIIIGTCCICCYMSLAECAVHIAYCYCCCQCTSISICDRNIVVTCCNACNIFCGCCKSSRSCPCIRKCSCCTGHCKIYRSIVHSTTRKCYCIGLCKCIGCLCYCYPVSYTHLRAHEDS